MTRETYLGPPGNPPTWTTETPLEALRDLDAARIVSLSPDVCLTPRGSAVVPVPYPIIDYCGHDTNYTPSVRFTRKKAMVMRSRTTHVHGDRPGTARGVTSGTVEDCCEPIGHASQVRAEGSNVIRHLDRFWMNNRNTVGEALFVRDMRSYPKPLDDDPVPGSLLAMQQQPTQWPQNGIAQAGAPPVAIPAPSDRTQPRTPTLGRKGILGQAILNEIIRDVTMPADQAAAEARAIAVYTHPAADAVIRDNKLLPGRQRVGFDNILTAEAWDMSSRYGLVISGDERIPLANDILSAMAARPVDVRTATAEEIEAILGGTGAVDHSRLSQQEYDRLIKALKAAGVRVTAEALRRGACLIGPYSVIKAICPGEAHHIVPDMTLRWGTRDEGMAGLKRIPNAPSLNNGMAICLTGTMHSGLHSSLNNDLKSLGERNIPSGTAPMASILGEVNKSIDGISGLSPECKNRAKMMAAGQVAPTAIQPGRTTTSLPSADAIRVLKQGSYAPVAR